MASSGAPSDPYADLRVLIHWHAPPGPPPVSRNQVIIGPFCEDVQGPDGIVSLKVPFGSYDIRSVVHRLPEHQRPDVVLVVVDASKTGLPARLETVDCPKALIVGDTHHLEAPIRYAFACLLAERFDVLVTDYTRQHLHFFHHADRARLAWIPGMWVHNYGLPFQDVRSPSGVFVGHMRHHVFRRRVLETIEASGLPFGIVSGVSRDEAARHYSEAAVTLNCSLNGDLNMRVFEAIGHGGFLLTDRLAPEAGLSSLFAEGEEAAYYEDAEDAVVKLRHYVERPERTAALARNGFTRFEREHRHELKMRQLISTVLADGRFAPPVWNDPRAEQSAPHEPGLLARLTVYEYLQERHRLGGGLRVLAMPAVDVRTLTDMLDLPRLRCTRLATAADEIAASLARLGYAGRLTTSAVPVAAEVLLATAQEIAGGEAEPALRASAVGSVVVLGGQGAVLESAVVRLAADGYTPVMREPLVFEKAGG